jgi:hypothetical protein
VVLDVRTTLIPDNRRDRIVVQHRCGVVQCLCFAFCDAAYSIVTGRSTAGKGDQGEQGKFTHHPIVPCATFLRQTEKRAAPLPGTTLKSFR